MAFDAKRYSRLDWAIVGGGAVVLVSTFLPWYGASVAGYSSSVSGWSSGFIGWFGAVLLIAGAVYVGLARQGVSVPQLPSGPAVAVAGTSLLGLLFIVWRWATLPSSHSLGIVIDYGPRFGIFLAMIAGVVQLVGAVLEFRGSGEKLPWDHTKTA